MKQPGLVHVTGPGCRFTGRRVAGESVPVFAIGDLRFGITICHNNHFPELALLHRLQQVDLILAPHAARTGVWPDPLTHEFAARTLAERQRTWEQVHVARALDHNVFVLLNNAVGPSTRGLEGVVANHTGIVMGVGLDGELFLRSGVNDFVDEVVAVELRAERRALNHGPTRNRRLASVVRQFERALEDEG